MEDNERKLPPQDNPSEDNTSQEEITQEVRSETTNPPPLQNNMFRSRVDLTPIRSKIDRVLEECSKIIIGQSELIELMVTCIIAEGHILLEGVPGIAKTLSAKVVAKTIDTEFSRIQFTPDLMPADIIGTSIFNMNTSEFIFKKGPIFSNMVLIDEINRAPAKTQSALFEVMEEKQISFDGTTYPMTKPFIVIATQNPIEQEGTYRLPEAQLDRFLMKINLSYPTMAEELEIINRFKNRPGRPDINSVQAVLNANDISEIQETLENIHIERQMLEYITQIIHETRNHAKVYLGASPRASLALLSTAKVTAVMAGRDFIIPDDIQFVAPHVLNHRMILTPDAEMEGITSFIVIADIIKTLEVPR
jgi:MoxR-like ATPase